MKILITGGAGYIGSVAAHALVKEGHEVIVVDNLSKGLKRLIPKEAEFIEADLTNKNDLNKAFQDIDAVMHFAAYKAVGESMENPKKYSDNLTGTINLLDLMVEHNVKKIIYSSSAAVYGMPDVEVIEEDAPTKPINYYGYTKLVCGELIEWYAKIHKIHYVSLRYFNVAGDAGLDYIDPEAENILPILMEVATGKRPKFVINGSDYGTPDGTCVRDYCDVRDLVRAHILALNTDFSGNINLGNQTGTSVKEFVDATKRVIGKDFTVETGPRRPGDPATLIASNARAKKVLNWEPEYDVDDMISSAYKAYTA